jgi:hypothetical protein
VDPTGHDPATIRESAELLPPGPLGGYPCLSCEEVRSAAAPEAGSKPAGGKRPLVSLKSQPGEGGKPAGKRPSGKGQRKRDEAAVERAREVAGKGGWEGSLAHYDNSDYYESDPKNYLKAGRGVRCDTPTSRPSRAPCPCGRSHAGLRV